MYTLKFCCGVGETGDFLLPGDYDSMKQAISEVEVQLRSAIQTARYERKKIVVATTSSRQPHAARALKSLKFKPVSTFRGHEGVITFWFKKLQRLS